MLSSPLRSVRRRRDVTTDAVLAEDEQRRAASQAANDIENFRGLKILFTAGSRQVHRLQSAIPWRGIRAQVCLRAACRASTK